QRRGADRLRWQRCQLRDSGAAPLLQRLRRPGVGQRHPWHPGRRGCLQRRRLRRLPARCPGEDPPLRPRGPRGGGRPGRSGDGLPRQRLHSWPATGPRGALAGPACLPGRLAGATDPRQRVGRPSHGGPAQGPQLRLRLQEPAGASRLVADRPGRPARRAHRRWTDLGEAHQLLPQPGQRQGSRYHGADEDSPGASQGALRHRSRARSEAGGRVLMASRVLKVGLLFGGRSAEHEVSIVSAQGVQDAINSDRFEAVPFGVTRQGIWLTPDESAQALSRLAPASYRSLPDTTRGQPTIRPEVLTALTACDVAFPLIHGTQGEDGTLQGMLELLGLPYVGAGVAASALGMDKDLMKRVFRQSGLPTPNWMTVTARDWREQIARREVHYPCFVKPANMGSSVGVSKVKDADGLGAAIELSLRYDRKALIGQAIAGREIEVAVLGNESPEASPPGEIT